MERHPGFRPLVLVSNHWYAVWNITGGPYLLRSRALLVQPRSEGRNSRILPNLVKLENERQGMHTKNEGGQSFETE